MSWSRKQFDIIQFIKYFFTAFHSYWPLLFIFTSIKGINVYVYVPVYVLTLPSKFHLLINYEKIWVIHRNAEDCRKTIKEPNNSSLSNRQTLQIISYDSKAHTSVGSRNSTSLQRVKSMSLRIKKKKKLWQELWICS
jgi:hypothetical protein